MIPPAAPARPPRRLRSVAWAAFAVVAGGCAGGADYGAYLKTWVGKPMGQLVADWGPPDYRFRDHRGRQAFQYIFHEVIAQSLGQGRSIVWWCLTTFRLAPAGQRVAAITIEGNHCFPPDDLAADRARRLTGPRVLPMVPPADPLL